MEPIKGKMELFVKALARNSDFYGTCSGWSDQGRNKRGMCWTTSCLMPIDSAYIGWNPVEIKIGNSLFHSRSNKRINVDRELGNIRNCSFASQAGVIGITAEDRTHGGQILGLFDYSRAKTDVLLRQHFLLHHSINSSGVRVCYTQPSTFQGRADLFLFHVKDRRAELVKQGIVAQDSIPVWFPDNRKIAYHSPEGYVEVIDLSSKRQTVLAEGRCPAVSINRGRLAFVKDSQFFVWDQTTQGVQRLPFLSLLEKREVSYGPCWSVDEKLLCVGVTSGLVDKQTEFYVFELDSEVIQKVHVKYVSGLLLVNSFAENIFEE